MGFLPFIVILISALKETVFKVPTPPGSPEAEAAVKDSFLWRMWSGLPKFIVGYLTICLLLSAVRASGALGAGYAELQALIRQAGNWLFAIGFVGVGILTNAKELVGQLSLGGLLGFAVAAELLDMAT